METLNDIIAKCVRDKNLPKLEKMGEEIDGLIDLVSGKIDTLLDRGVPVDRQTRANLMTAQANSLLIDAGIRKIKGLD